MDKLRSLQYFVAAAEEKSLSGAARRFGVSTQAVAKLVSALEHGLGVRLFERTAAGVKEQKLEPARFVPLRAGKG